MSGMTDSGYFRINDRFELSLTLFIPSGNAVGTARNPVTKMTLARFLVEGLVETEDFAGSLFEAGVEASRGQVHAVGQPFDDGIDRGELGVRLAVGRSHDPRPGLFSTSIRHNLNRLLGRSRLTNDQKMLNI